MLLMFGSVFTLVASAVLFCKSRKNWPLVGAKIWWHLKYNQLASTELVRDLVNAKLNRTDFPVRTDKIAIVTGGSRGIGFTIVKWLLKCDMEVIIACRRPEAGEKAIKSIRESGVTTGRPKVYVLDNASFDSVRQFAKQIQRDYKRINILINNAGIMFTPYMETEDGFEQQWAVNYLSHFLLTSLLLPLLKTGGSEDEHSRVVNVTSCAHLLGNINLNDINARQEFVTAAAYAQSKLAQVIFAKKLQSLLSQKNICVDVYSVHPGLVDTDIFNDTYINKIKWIVNLIFKTPEEGAIPIVYTALSKNVEGKGGTYISNCKEIPAHPAASDPIIQEKLFKLSLEQVKLHDFFQHN